MEDQSLVPRWRTRLAKSGIILLGHFFARFGICGMSDLICKTDNLTERILLQKLEVSLLKKEILGTDKKHRSAYIRKFEEEFTDFVLRLDWRAPGIFNNSGVYVRLPEGRLNSVDAALTSGYEIQIDNTGERPGDASSFPQEFNNPFHQTGAIYPVHRSVSFPDPNGKPTNGTIPTRAFGEWNALEITARGNRISVVLNGHATLAGGDYEDRNSTYPRGHVALQNHFKGFGVQFRRVRIKIL